jgi:alanyl-tRNA synthetase
VVEVPGFSKEFCGGTHVGQTGEIGLFLLTAEQGISAGTRRVEAIAGEAAIERAQGDQGILEELERAARVDRRELVDEYARLRDQLKAREREIQALRMKLATAAGPPAAEDLAEIAGALVWTPRFEGLDRKAHAAVVDEFRNRNKDRRFALVSASIAEEGVGVIAAVSPSLGGSIKAPDLMKQLGLRGGGRPDFAQGGGVAAGEVDAMRRRATELLRGLLEAVPHV